MSIESVISSNHFTLYHPLLLLPSIFLNIKVFSSESVLCIRWPKYWSFSFSISPPNEYSGLISFRMDWLDLLQIRWFYVTSLPIFWLPLSSLSGSPLHGAGQVCFVLLIPIQCSIWHLCFLTRDQTHASFSRSTEFEPLGKSQIFFFF